MTDLAQVNITTEPLVTLIQDNTPAQIVVTDDVTTEVTVIDQITKVFVEGVEYPSINVFVGNIGNGGSLFPGSILSRDQAMARWDDAYSWGDHDGLYEPKDTNLSIIHRTDYEYNLWNEAHSWGDHKGLYTPVGAFNAYVQNSQNLYNRLVYDLSQTNDQLGEWNTDWVDNINAIINSGWLSQRLSELILFTDTGLGNAHTNLLNAIAAVNTNITGNMDVTHSYFTTTNSAITAAVSRLTTTETSLGTVIDSTNAYFGITDAAISSVVSRVHLAEGNITATQSRIDIADDEILLATSRLDTTENNLSNVQIQLDANAILLEVAETRLDDFGVTMVNQQEMLSNAWTVKIQEDAYGNRSAAGFGLFMYPSWQDDKAYIIGDNVYYGSEVYQCLTAHQSSVGSIPGAYWELIPYGVRSEFGVMADRFFIQAANGTKHVPFIVDADTGTVRINGELIIGGQAGDDGIDGTSVEFIFYRSDSDIPPAVPAISQVDGYVPAGWTSAQQGVSGVARYEYVSKRSKIAGVWQAFSSPVLWGRYAEDGAPGAPGDDGIDGASVEFIFRQGTTSTPPTTPATSQMDAYIPAGWTDNQSGVTSTYAYEFSSKRTKTAGVWGVFSAPKLWATFSEDGAPGANAVIAILSNEAHTLPAAATGTIANYAGSGTEIRVYEGTTPLNYDASSTANGYWKIASVLNTSITVGSFSDSGSYVIVGNSSAMSSVSSTASITFTITGKTATGSPFNIIKTQTLTKAFAGIAGANGANGTNGATGDPGAAGPTLMLTASKQSFTFTDGVLDGAQSITLTALKQNYTGTVSWSSSPYISSMTGTGDSKTLTSAYFGSNRQVTVTITSGSLTDTVTILRLEKSTASAGADVTSAQDLAALVNLKTTTINGGKITTNTVIAAHVISDELTQISSYSSSPVSISITNILQTIHSFTIVPSALGTSKLTILASLHMHIPAACEGVQFFIYQGADQVGHTYFKGVTTTGIQFIPVSMLCNITPGTTTQTYSLKGITDSTFTCSIFRYSMCIIDRRR